MNKTNSYIIGYVLSVLLTVMPFLMVYYKTVSGASLIAAIICFAVLQLLVQLIFFLHLGSGKNGRWNLMAFMFMAMVVGIIVAGSLWIMHNLDYHMSPAEVEKHLIEGEGIKH